MGLRYKFYTDNNHQTILIIIIPANIRDSCQNVKRIHKFQIIKFLTMEGKNEEYKCEKCDFSTNRQSKLRGHLCINTYKQSDTQSDQKLFDCKVCGKKLTTKGIMKRHLHDRHSGGRPFDCLICSKSFKQKNHLKRHMNNLHSSDRQISCDLRSNLPIHNKELDVGQGSHKINSSEVCGKIREGVGKKPKKIRLSL